MACRLREPRASMMPTPRRDGRRPTCMNWKALVERMDPRKWNCVLWLHRRAIGLVANRSTVLATSVALLIGLWGRGGAGAGVARRARVRFRAARFHRRRESGAPQCAARRLAADRRQLSAPAGGTDRPEPRACLEFSPESFDRSVGEFRRLLVLAPAAPFQSMCRATCSA